MSQLTSITIVAEQPFPQVVEELRGVGLLGDPSAKPYQHATFELRTIDPEDVAPLSRYVLKENLNTQRQLRTLFMDQHGIDTFNLDKVKTSIIYKANGVTEEWLMAPPLVEESSLDGQPVLVDGEHRLLLAREMGQKIKVIWVSQVEPRFPVVALPLKWSDVQQYDQVPEVFKKRDYRYPTLEEFPDVSAWSQVPITEKNYLYFFYRDLNPICSTGVRAAGSKGATSK